MNLDEYLNLDENYENQSKTVSHRSYLDTVESNSMTM